MALRNQPMIARHPCYILCNYFVLFFRNNIHVKRRHPAQHKKKLSADITVLLKAMIDRDYPLYDCFVIIYRSRNVDVSAVLHVFHFKNDVLARHVKASEKQMKNKDLYILYVTEYIRKYRNFIGSIDTL